MIDSSYVVGSEVWYVATLPRVTVKKSKIVDIKCEIAGLATFEKWYTLKSGYILDASQMYPNYSQAKREAERVQGDRI